MLKGETTMLRICGSCVYASRTLNSHEIRLLRSKVPFRERYFNYLALLRRHANSLRDKKVLCRRENIEVSLLDEACALWRPHCQRSQV